MATLIINEPTTANKEREFLRRLQHLRQQSAELRYKLDGLQRSMRDARLELIRACDHNWIQTPPEYQHLYTCSKCGNMK